VLAGATASGKTELAIALAQRFNAEIIGADSRQIYKGMPIGTAAPSAAQRAAVPHHLVEFIEPADRYSAAQFAQDALDCITDIHARGKRAIVVGGTGFYIRTLTGAVTLAPPAEMELRQRLSYEARIHEPAFLHQWLAARDPQRSKAIAPEDRYRVLRALEISLMRNERRPGNANDSLASRGVPFVKVFLDVPEAILERRIEERVDAMLRTGLIEEAEEVGADAVAASAVGYLQALAYLRGWQTYAEFRDAVCRATRRYAKRQRTWFRSEPQTVWLRSDDPLRDVSNIVQEKLAWA